MTRLSNISLFLLRVSLGWVFLYAGLIKIQDPGWSAAGYIKGAKTFNELYQLFALPQYMHYTDLLNEWGLTLIGVALILGIVVRFASYCGILLMLLYYFPVLDFPKVGYSYLVDEHIVYILALLVLIAFRAGEIWGLEVLFRRISKVPSSHGKFI